MKKSVKILSVILMAILLVSFMASNVLAESKVQSVFDQITEGDTTLDGDVMTKVSTVLGILRNVALVISVFIIIILGIKYITGSLEQKADYKKSFLPLIIGMVLVVGATTIAKWLFDIANNI